MLDVGLEHYFYDFRRIVAFYIAVPVGKSGAVALFPVDMLEELPVDAARPVGHSVLGDLTVMPEAEHAAGRRRATDVKFVELNPL